MPFKTFNNWLFDGNSKTPIPQDLLTYNSPITHTFVISLFLKNGPLNHYLDQYFNDINVRYLDKSDLFMFVKKCVMDFRVRKNNMMFYKRRQRNLLFEKLRDKIPYLKNDDLFLLCDIIDKSDEKDSVYETLGLEKQKKKKLKKTKVKEKKNISLKDFLEQHFSIVKT